jgi:hypothetical protein
MGYFADRIFGQPRRRTVGRTRNAIFPGKAIWRRGFNVNDMAYFFCVALDEPQILLARGLQDPSDFGPCG